MVQLLNQMARKADRVQKAQQRNLEADARAQKRLYAESQLAMAEQMNAQLHEEIAVLDGLLAEALEADNYLDLDNLKVQPDIPPFEPGSLVVEDSPPLASQYRPKAPGFFRRLLPGTKASHKDAVARAREEYQCAVQAYKKLRAKKKKQLSEARAAHISMVKSEKAAAAEQHRQVEGVKADLKSGNPEAIVSYFSAALERSVYPDEFPQQMRVAYVPESKQLVIEYDLPSIQVVPDVKEYKYVKSKDSIAKVMRSVNDRKRIYTGVVCQITIRTLHEIFETDRLKNVETVVFNTFIESQKSESGEALLTLVQFDGEYEFVHKGVPIGSVSRFELVPRGSTALLDAVGRAINETGARLAAMDESQRPGLVVVVIVTDGAENSSKEFALNKIREMIEHQQSVYNWQFTFLAANQDAFAEGAKLGIADDYISKFDLAAVGFAFGAAAKKTSRMRQALIDGNAPCDSGGL